MQCPPCNAHAVQCPPCKAHAVQMHSVPHARHMQYSDFTLRPHAQTHYAYGVADAVILVAYNAPHARPKQYRRTVSPMQGPCSTDARCPPCKAHAVQCDTERRCARIQLQPHQHQAAVQFVPAQDTTCLTPPHSPPPHTYPPPSPPPPPHTLTPTLTHPHIYTHTLSHPHIHSHSPWPHTPAGCNARAAQRCPAMWPPAPEAGLPPPPPAVRPWPAGRKCGWQSWCGRRMW